MFLRKEINNEPTGVKYVVPYCKDCHSQDIEIIKTCKHCGSHNISTGYNILSDDVKYCTKEEYKEVTKYIYKCDNCGKEFDGSNIDNYLSYADGAFEQCNYNRFEDSDYIDYTNYQLNVDLCQECKKQLQTHLQVKLIDFVRPEHINELINEYLEKDGNK